MHAFLYLLIAQPPGDMRLSAAELAQCAARDLAAQSPSLQPYLRYAYFTRFPPPLREKAITVFAGHVQHLSRQPRLKAPVVVPGSGRQLVRLYTEDYRWDTKVWDSLVSPFDHVQATVQEEYGYYQYGRWVSTGYRPRQVTALSPAFSATEGGKKAVGVLIELTCSPAPLIDARWFFNQTATSQGRKPGYYDFLGIKDEKTFNDVIGFDKTKSRAFRFEIREATNDSGVTVEKTRAFARDDAQGGGRWASLDSEKGVDKKNALRVLGRDIEAAYDASEVFAVLPNGFPVMGVFTGPGSKDGAGKALGAAPGTIASDYHSKTNDKQVYVNASCIRCHGPHKQLFELDAVIKGSFTPPPLKLISPDPEKSVELEQAYFRNIGSFLKKDRIGYEEAFKDATAWDAKTYAEHYAWMWEYHEDARVDLAWAAHDLDVTPEHFRAVLLSRLIPDAKGVAPGIDQVISLLLKGRTLGMRQWEEAYATADSYLALERQKK